MNIIFRSWLFDFLYTMADQMIKKYNPCQIHKDDSGKVSCLLTSPCCTNCKFLGPEGCTTKCLGCKLALCGAAREANSELSKVLSKMMNIAWHYGLGRIRMSKEETFDRFKNKRLSDKRRYKGVTQ